MYDKNYSETPANADYQKLLYINAGIILLKHLYLILVVDGDLYTDVLVPACLDEKCAQSVLLVYTNKKVRQVLYLFLYSLKVT
jgi:hypothetical protein